MVFKNLCILVLWTKVALALEGLIHLELALYLKCSLATSSIVRVNLNNGTFVEFHEAFLAGLTKLRHISVWL